MSENSIHDDCVMKEKIIDIMARLTAIQETINNEVYGHGEKTGLKADVMVLQMAEEKRQKLVGFVWSSFITAVVALGVSLFKTNR